MRHASLYCPRQGRVVDSALPRPFLHHTVAGFGSPQAVHQEQTRQWGNQIG
uniref:Uncharacterized protein n=1 Tax=Anguilla anguilla TaxID=7936 RepID=A0A0E9XCV4_ANGAN